MVKDELICVDGDLVVLVVVVVVVGILLEESMIMTVIELIIKK